MSFEERMADLTKLEAEACLFAEAAETPAAKARFFKAAERYAAEIYKLRSRDPDYEAEEFEHHLVGRW